MSNTQDLIQQANNRMVDAIPENKKLKECIKYLEAKVAELEQAIMSNCYDDHSTSGKRLMALVTKGGAE